MPWGVTQRGRDNPIAVVTRMFFWCLNGHRYGGCYVVLGSRFCFIPCSCVHSFVFLSRSIALYGVCEKECRREDNFSGLLPLGFVPILVGFGGIEE